MSTALVSAFYDVGDILYQNRRIGLEQKAVGSPLHSLQQSRNIARHSSTSALRSSPVSMKITPPNSPMISETSSFTTMLGRDQTLSNNLLSSGSTQQFHRKLDRTYSEPSPVLDNNNAKNTTNLNNANNLNNNTQSQNVNSARYKTEMCRPFEENGHCKYGDKCQFAHGAHELRTVNRHPKFKTELCRTFHTIGFCPYGPRCHFIHSDAERTKGSQMNNSKQGVPQHVQANQPAGGPPGFNHTQPMQRPKALSFSSYHLPLGSCADSPPSSINSDSPSLSPVFFDEPMTFGALQQQNYAQTAPPCSGMKFKFPPPTEIVPSPTGLNTGSTPFDAQIQQLLRNISDPRVQEELFGAPVLPPSPPSSICGDNVCGSPLDVSKNLRLPIFSRLSIHDEY